MVAGHPSFAYAIVSVLNILLLSMAKQATDSIKYAAMTFGEHPDVL